VPDAEPDAGVVVVGASPLLVDDALAAVLALAVLALAAPSAELDAADVSLLPPQEVSRAIVAAASVAAIIRRRDAVIVLTGLVLMVVSSLGR
jgi:hypothetical protein